MKHLINTLGRTGPGSSKLAGIEHRIDTNLLSDLINLSIPWNSMRAPIENLIVFSMAEFKYCTNASL